MQRLSELCSITARGELSAPLRCQSAQKQRGLHGHVYIARVSLAKGPRPLQFMPLLLKVLGLRVEFVESPLKRIHAVNGVSFDVCHGEVLGILGESGSGKSTIAKASLRLLPKNAEIIEGVIEFEGRALIRLKEHEMESLRGARMAMIPQEPSLALNPVMKAGDQIAEVIRAHRDWTWKRCREEANILLERMHLNSSGRRMYDAYPHQLSGGQQQRVAIAQALACQPALIIADEPTASLDSETEDEILKFLRELRAEQKMSLMLITHDPKILSGLADRVAVMYGGPPYRRGQAGSSLS
jgi:ABC-type glutathione transport system ATPase component